MVKFSLATPDEISTEMARRIKLARIARNMTQVDLAQRTGVSLGTIRKIERTGDCGFRTIIKVAQALRLESGLDRLFEMGIQSIDEMIAVDRAKMVMRSRASRPRSRASAQRVAVTPR